LAERLSDGVLNPNIYNDLTDYIWLLDKIERRAQNAGKKPGDPDYSDWYRDPDYVLRLQDVPTENRAEDLTDWLITYQSEDGFEHALKRWKETAKVHWLVAALAKTRPEHPSAEGLVHDANQLKQTSPAFYTAMYHAIRISLHSGNRLQAEKLTNRVFEAGFESVPVATKNSFYAQRMESATGLSEFLKYAKRMPTSYLWSDDFNEMGTEMNENAGLKTWKDKPMFDEDAVEILNTSVPLNVWVNAANNSEVPGRLRDFIASAGWMRAFFLKDASAEAQFSRLMNRYSQDYSQLMRGYYNARSDRERESAALLAIGRYAVLEPSIASKWGRKTSDPKTIDSNRGNWWCLSPDPKGESERPAFLSAVDHAKGKAEYKSLRSLGEGSSAFASRAVDFAKRNPKNQMTPEILHLAVRATRFGCRDSRTGALSKEAFDLLHRRYKNSAWAKRTRFWYS
ncbi:MAG: hypothetical protein OEQ28_09040, partial [Acidobacteriota bacterium]|nr:hypothetical protein [Acidobacteriota bacterium]